MPNVASAIIHDLVHTAYWTPHLTHIVYPKKYAHGFVVLCFVVVMQSFIMNSHEVFIHIHQGCFAGTGAIVRLPQCQWSKPDDIWEIQSMYNHNKAQQNKNRVHISWDILYTWRHICLMVIKNLQSKAYIKESTEMNKASVFSPWEVIVPVSTIIQFQRWEWYWWLSARLQYLLC